MTSVTRKNLLEWAGTIVVAIVLSLVIRSYVAEARWIPSESMLPTLKVGDHLMTDKISYQFKSIQRGDIVVFTPPAEAHIDEDALIKRVIGLPGDSVSIQERTVYINGKPLKEPYLLEKPREDLKPFTVPEDHVFVMGDNRNNSYDSRFWGPLPTDNIIGRAMFLYYPFNHLKVLTRG